MSVTKERAYRIRGQVLSLLDRNIRYDKDALRDWQAKVAALKPEELGYELSWSSNTLERMADLEALIVVRDLVHGMADWIHADDPIAALIGRLSRRALRENAYGNRSTSSISNVMGSYRREKLAYVVNATIDTIQNLEEDDDE